MASEHTHDDEKKRSFERFFFLTLIIFVRYGSNIFPKVDLHTHTGFCKKKGKENLNDYWFMAW